MRRNIVHPGADALSYAIREIVLVAKQFERHGQPITWENIGDPVQKGEKISPWIRDAVRKTIEDDASWAYCDTAGVPATREFLAGFVNARGGAKITPDDILFFNGLGDAISRVYTQLAHEARVIGPTPAYSTHSSAESAHSGNEHLTYRLDPANNWMPDVDDLRSKVRRNKSITGILLINPNNPTGTVYPREVLDPIVEIARQNDLFIICDEIYAHIVYGGAQTLHISEVLGDVCGIAMRGISKEYPWPGSRCGWVEILNRGRDEVFGKYVDSLLAAKRLEVCSTTLPQMSIPRVMGDPRYSAHLDARAKIFERRAKEACAAFAGIDGIIVNEPQGAFYLPVHFKPGVLRKDQRLPIGNVKIREMVETLSKTASNDGRFVYYLMGATGICTVPLTGFYSAFDGFRVTLLECNDAKRKWIFKTLASAVKQYLAS